MLGIEDTYVWLAYVLCLASTALCVVWGLVNWNKGEEAVKDEDVHWVQEEQKVEEEL